MLYIVHRAFNALFVAALLADCSRQQIRKGAQDVIWVASEAVPIEVDFRIQTTSYMENQTRYIKEWNGVVQQN